MISIGNGDIFEPIAYLIGKLISKVGQEIYRAFDRTPIEDWTTRQWWYLFCLLAFTTITIVVLVYLKKRNANKINKN